MFDSAASSAASRDRMTGAMAAMAITKAMGYAATCAIPSRATKGRIGGTCYLGTRHARARAMQGDASPLTLLTERLVLTLPGPEAAQRMVAYFENNRRHLGPWEPPFPPGMFTTSFWERRLVQNQDEYRTGKSMRLALLDRRD